MQNILIVDDDTDLLAVLRLSLSRYDYRVTTLSDPSTVQQMIDASNPALILLDINMGEWDGREVCKSIKANSSNRDIRIILYSALEDGAVSLETCKADLFLKKPLSTQVLVSELSKFSKAS